MSTADAISPDSDRPWATPGAWPVAPGVWRIPLPLPNDGLRAVNVYALRTRDEDGEGLTLIDGGWAIEEASDLLDAALASLGAGAGDVRGFLVTHAHRDHYTQAVAMRRRTGAPITMGRGEQASLDLIREGAPAGRMPTVRLLRSAGSPDLAELWLGAQDEESFDRTLWEDPDSWIEGDAALRVGERTLDAVHTPGHTRGHFVFADRDAGLLLAGDHVLPTITPSIGFEAATVASPLADYLASLAKVRALPDLRLLPAHGPVAGSVHARVDELLAHHDERLLASRDAVERAGSSAHDVAAALPWTRRRRTLDELGPFDQMLAVLETRAHLEVLAARGELRVERAAADDGPARYLLG